MMNQEIMKLEMEMAVNGWNMHWFVHFWPLVLNMTGFDDDDDDELHGMANITVLSVSSLYKIVFI